MKTEVSSGSAAKSNRELGLAAAEAQRAGKSAIRSEAAVRQAKQRYKAAKRTWKHARKAARKAHKLARKTQRKLEKLLAKHAGAKNARLKGSRSRPGRSPKSDRSTKTAKRPSPGTAAGSSNKPTTGASLAATESET